MKDFYTLKEIEQQKRLWLETINLVKEKKEEIKTKTPAKKTTSTKKETSKKTTGTKKNTTKKK